MSGGISVVSGAIIGGVVGLLVAPALARLTATAADRGVSDWWRGAPVARERYLLTALIAVALGVFGGYAAGLGAVLPALVVLALGCTVATIVDARCHLLPNRILGPTALAGGLLLVLAAAVGGEWSQLVRALVAALVVFAALYLLALLAGAAFGLGDVKLGALLAGYLGWFGADCVLDGLAAGFLLGALLALLALATRRATLRSALPFGPMLIAGAFIVLAAHRTLAAW